uniref:Retrovirus-related Pol polyprotein from transposon TNT 1-94 n=1 Tax=Tanacetum cinerariifolium TaxID=118510 RepID=A0A6L2MJ64_TANCI|nr:retrovirus-related Pol polyprotein from transposon TNT 1-94 [Tanacetum cinerariifolium]
MKVLLPKPRKPRFLLRWSPTGRLFDHEGKLAASSNSESQYDCSNGDNACTSNAMEPKIKRFSNSTSLLDMLFRFVYAAILGFGDLQWGNILITRVYFVEGLGHNLFSVGQFCDSDLEVAFRRNDCFVKNLEGVDLLKGDRSTNLYIINLHKMASALPICLMARASSTKSWLWHQRLSHLNFDTINDLARNDLVAGLPKFKSKDEAPEVIIKFLKRITVLLQFPVIIIRTDNGIEFKNQVLKEYFDTVGISHQLSFVRTPQQNGVVERRNRTLVEAARTMLIFSRAPLFLWAEAIATECFTQNHSIIHRRFNKTPYELINGKKPDISFLHVFGALCYPKNDRADIGKLDAKGDIGFFIGYSTDSCAYRVYNHQTKKIMETMNVSFDELSAMGFEQRSSKPELNSMTSGHITLGLDLTYAPSTITTQQPSEGELDLLFEAMYDDYIGGQPLATARTIPPAQEPQVRQSSTTSTSIGDTAPIPTNSSSHATNVPITSQDVDKLNPNAMVDGNTFVNPFANPSTREPSRPVLIRNQLRSDGDMCMYALTVSIMEPKNVKEVMTDLAWIDSMQEELLQFKRLDSKYVLEILSKYGVKSCDPVGTPMEIKDKLDLHQNGTPIDATKYRSMIGALMYLTSSRPDIVHATCLCARYQSKPTEKHLKEVKRIFHYLQGTVNTGLWYMKDSGFELTGFSDADYAGCKDTIKSTSGGAQFLGEKLVSWSSKKQDCTALSTVEAEYVSLSACCAQVLWMQTKLTDYGFHFNKIPIYCDSKSAIAISCNPVQHSRTKHITVCYHFIKEHVEKGTIELYFFKTDYQLADIFTKALPTDHFNYLVRRLGMRSLSPKELERLAKSQ